MPSQKAADEVGGIGGEMGFCSDMEHGIYPMPDSPVQPEILFLGYSTAFSPGLDVK